jgi:hypothetical protein
LHWLRFQALYWIIMVLKECCQFSPFNGMLAISLLYVAFITSICSFFRAFYHEEIFNFVKAFLSSIEIMWFLSLIPFMCCIICLLICICQTILAFLVWNQFDHGAWSFQCVVQFGLQGFYWGLVFCFVFTEFMIIKEFVYSFLFLL